MQKNIRTLNFNICFTPSRDHGGLEFKILPPKNQPNIFYTTIWQYCLGIAKPENVFRSALNPSSKLIWNFLLTINTNSCFQLRNETGYGLISQFNVAVLFANHGTYIACTMVLTLSSFVPCFFLRCWFVGHITASHIFHSSWIDCRCRV